MLIWSVSEKPVSLAAVNVGAVGAAGRTVSISTVWYWSALSRPMLSLALKVTVCVPSSGTDTAAVGPRDRDRRSGIDP